LAIVKHPGVKPQVHGGKLRCLTLIRSGNCVYKDMHKDTIFSLPSNPASMGTLRLLCHVVTNALEAWLFFVRQSLIPYEKPHEKLSMAAVIVVPSS
jgi:hypothetical protein